MAFWDKELHFDKVVNPAQKQSNEHRNETQQNKGKVQTSEAEKKLQKALEKLKEYSDYAVEYDMNSFYFENGKLNLVAVVGFMEVLEKTCDEHFASRNYYKSRYNSLKAKYDELGEYMEHINATDGYEKWKSAQAHGRPRKTIDWEQYDLLTKAHVNQKQKAQILGVSPNTLRKLLKER